MAAGDFTLTRNDRFPDGTTVDVYDGTEWDYWPGLNLAGAALTSGAMTSGSVSFSGLGAAQRCFARAVVGGEERLVRFTAAP